MRPKRQGVVRLRQYTTDDQMKSINSKLFTISLLPPKYTKINWKAQKIHTTEREILFLQHDLNNVQSYIEPHAEWKASSRLHRIKCSYFQIRSTGIPNIKKQGCLELTAQEDLQL